jgi:hypothetical protein
MDNQKSDPRRAYFVLAELNALIFVFPFFFDILVLISTTILIENKARPFVFGRSIADGS